MAKSLRFEGLEGRSMLSGNATVELRGNAVVVSGDSAANELRVGYDASHRLAIFGIATGIVDVATGRTSTVFVLPPNVRGIEVNLGGGNDKIEFVGDGKAYTRMFEQVTVHGGPGKDTIAARDAAFGNFDCFGDGGDDLLKLSRVGVVDGRFFGNGGRDLNSLSRVSGELDLTWA